MGVEKALAVSQVKSRSVCLQVFPSRHPRFHEPVKMAIGSGWPDRPGRPGRPALVVV
jgi:hypothetical protein